MDRDSKGRFINGHKPYKIYGERSDEVKENIRKGHIGINKGKDSGMWKDGRRIVTGYVTILQEDGTYVSEQRKIAGQALGRKLKRNEVVHHINGIRNDNRNCNLLICTKSYHMWLHQRMAQKYMEEHFVHNK